MLPTPNSLARSPWFDAVRPYTGAPAGAYRAKPSLPARIDQFEPQGAVSLRYARTPLLPGTLGAPVPARDDDATLAPPFPPPDLDEAAGFIGRIRMFGPTLGRAIMLGGGLWAAVATVVAGKGISEEYLESKALSAELLDHEKLATKNTAFVAVARAWRAELRERLYTLWGNVLLVPGSLGMAVNLLGSAELLGAVLPRLVPVADWAMGPAVACMTVYGGLVAIKALADVSRSVTRSRALVRQPAPEGVAPDLDRRVRQALLGRERQGRWWDAALGVAGAMQAVGAVAQWVLGPWWLLVLLPGTLGLGLIKQQRAKRMGHALYTPRPEAAELAVPRAELMGHYAKASAARTRLEQPILADAASLSACLRALIPSQPQPDGRALENLVQGRNQGGVAEDHALIDAMVAVQLFGPLALAVAQDPRMPRTRHATADGTAYQVTAADLKEWTEAVPDYARALRPQLQAHMARVLRTSGLSAVLRREAVLADVLAHGAS